MQFAYGTGIAFFLLFLFGLVTLFIIEGITALGGFILRKIKSRIKK